MFNILRIVCLFAWAGHGAYASEEAFHHANELFAQEKFEEAISVYESALLNGASANLYFNLGNAYLKSKNYGAAILNFRRALLLSPQDTDINANLRLAQRQAELAVDDPTPLTIYSRFLTTNQWILIATIAGWITLALIILKFRRTQTPRFVILSTILSAVVLLSSLAGLVGYHQTRNQAVIAGQMDATLKVAPTPQSPATLSLLRGTTVVILKEVNGFDLIKTSTGQTGYIEPALLQRVLPESNLFGSR